MKTEKCPLCGSLDGKHIRQCNISDIHIKRSDRIKARKLNTDSIMSKLKENRKTNK